MSSLLKPTVLLVKQRSEETDPRAATKRGRTILLQRERILFPTHQIKPICGRFPFDRVLKSLSTRRGFYYSFSTFESACSGFGKACRPTGRRMTHACPNAFAAVKRDTDRCAVALLADASSDFRSHVTQRSRLFHNLIRTTQRPPGYVAHNISRDPGLVDCTVDLCARVAPQSGINWL
eukprot:g57199.t1